MGWIKIGFDTNGYRDGVVAGFAIAKNNRIITLFKPRFNQGIEAKAIKKKKTLLIECFILIN